jgi:chromosome segregation ATPase
MAKAENYNDLMFQLGDLARERLVNKVDRPRAMERVLRAEDLLVQRREELASFEAEMNEADVAYQESLAALEEERSGHREIVKKYQRAVNSIEGRVKELRKKLSSAKADVRYNRDAIKKAEAKHKDLEMTSHGDPARVEMSKQNLKKIKLSVMRQERQLEDLEFEFSRALTPEPGNPGAPGILAHKALLELEDAEEERKIAFEEQMGEIDARIAAKEQEVQAAEDYLDQAIFLLGEECYQKRIPDPALAALYPRIDKAK